MQTEIFEKEIYEVFYHPSVNTRNFKFSFASLQLAKELILKEYPDFFELLESKIKYPYISIRSKGVMGDCGKAAELFFGKAR